MADTDKNEIYLSPAPHIASPVTTRKLMIHVLIALAPLALYGIYLYGVPALIRIIVSVGVAVGAEAAFRKAMGKDIRIKACFAAAYSDLDCGGFRNFCHRRSKRIFRRTRRQSL